MARRESKGSSPGGLLAEMTTRLLYGTTSELAVTIFERFNGSRYHLFLADSFHAWPPNPSSANPIEVFLEFTSIYQRPDRFAPKFFTQKRGIRRMLRERLSGSLVYNDALKTVDVADAPSMRPYLAIIEVHAYETNHDTVVAPLLPHRATSIPSIEYFLEDIHGPAHAEPEMHLQKLFFP